MSDPMASPTSGWLARARELGRSILRQAGRAPAGVMSELVQLVRLAIRIVAGAGMLVATAWLVSLGALTAFRSIQWMFDKWFSKPW